MNQVQAMHTDAADQVFAALGDATRRAIVKLVAQGRNRSARWLLR